MRRRGSKETEALAADLAFDCTGHRPDLASPLIESLVSQGAASVDAHRLGLAVQPNGQALGRGGAPTPGLFALGPLCQGSLWEITAVPEIVHQCDAAAQSIAALARAGMREVELTSAGPANPRIFRGKGRMVNVTGPEKATKLRIPYGCCGGQSRRC